MKEENQHRRVVYTRIYLSISFNECMSIYSYACHFDREEICAFFHLFKDDFCVLFCSLLHVERVAWSRTDGRTIERARAHLWLYFFSVVSAYRESICVCGALWRTDRWQPWPQKTIKRRFLACSHLLRMRRTERGGLSFTSVDEVRKRPATTRCSSPQAA